MKLSTVKLKKYIRKTELAKAMNIRKQILQDAEQIKKQQWDNISKSGKSFKFFRI